MPTVVIEHEAKIWVREGLTVVVDGHPCGAVAPGAKTELIVEQGRHRIWLASKLATSLVVTIDADAREEYGFVCRSEGLVNRSITLQPAYVRKPSNRFETRARASRQDMNKMAKVRKEGDEWTAILGIEPDASAEEIRRAYLERISLHHPDRVAHLPLTARVSAGEEARRINLAYRAAKNALIESR